MNVRKQPRRNRGFTLMEVLLVLVILVILGSMVAVSLTGARKRAYIDLSRTQMNNLKSSLNGYYGDIGSFPTSQQGLGALLAAPGDLRNPTKWRGPYLEGQTIPQDPWGNDFRYESTGDAFTLYSAGPNQQAENGNGDDIVVTGQ